MLAKYAIVFSICHNIFRINFIILNSSYNFSLTYYFRNEYYFALIHNFMQKFKLLFSNIFFTLNIAYYVYKDN